MNISTIFSTLAVAGLTTIGTLAMTACSTGGTDSMSSNVMHAKGAMTANSMQMEMKNKKIATEALTQMFDKLDSSKVDTYYADGYIQHSPGIEDGKAGLKGAIDGMKGYVTIKREIFRVISEGDLVFVQSRVSFNGGKPNIVNDLFRIENGKIAEHWDTTQEETPKEKTASGNSMVDGGGDVTKKVSDAYLMANKKSATDFVNKGFANGDKKLLESLFGAEYIQHNPDVPNGKEAVLGFMKDGEGFPAQVRKVVAQGDLVVALVEYGQAGTNFHNACHDLFRFDDNSKIVEHWDVCQAVPPASEFKHSNGMF